MTPTLANGVHHYKHLVDEVDSRWWSRLVGRLAHNHGLSDEIATLVLGEAVGFLKLCIDHSRQRFGPSAPVALGWQAMLADTLLYRRLCWRLGGGCVDHRPDDPFVKPSGPCLVPQTRLAMRRNGPTLDALWECSLYKADDPIPHGCGRNCHNGSGKCDSLS
jgi:hypothetical protein